jgi:hypothetical protein
MSEPDFYGGDPLRSIMTVHTGFDMCLCPGGNCPQRFLCLRFLAEIVNRQDSFGSPPFMIGYPCPEFLDARPVFKKALHREKIINRAQDLSKSHLNLEDFYWLLAEFQLKLEGFTTAEWVNDQKGNHSLSLSTIPESHIRECAYYLWKNHHYTLKELHWLIAEQQILFDAFVLRNEEKKH